MARERDMMIDSSRRHVFRIKESMRDYVLRNRVVICSRQCEQLIVRFQEQSDRVLAIFKPVDLQRNSSSRYDRELLALVDRFICNMEAVEDLLYLCAEVDWKVAALSVFLPPPSDPKDSNFALLARDLDWTAHELHKLLRPRPALEIEPFLRGLIDFHHLDCLSVLHKLESGPSKKSVFQPLYEFFRPSKRPFLPERYTSLLKKRLQVDALLRLEADASPSTPSSVPNWCWIPYMSEYSIARVVGRGSSKSVLKCHWLGMDVAIALYKGEHAKRNMETEAGILATVQHPNVVTLFGCAYDDEQEEGHLVTELMEQDLGQLIRKTCRARRGRQRMPFSLSVSKDIILQIVEATIHMREFRVLHRDLKPANCLVRAKKRLRQNDNKGETYYVVKLIDFGSAKVRGADESTCHTRKQGTTAYMAPELHAMPNDCAYKWSVDVYSLGMTMYEILSGECPFEGVYAGEELARKVCEGERPFFPEWVPGDWRELIENCWHRDPKQRPGFEDVLEEVLKCTTSLNF